MHAGNWKVSQLESIAESLCDLSATLARERSPVLAPGRLKSCFAYVCMHFTELILVPQPKEFGSAGVRSLVPRVLECAGIGPRLYLSAFAPARSPAFVRLR